MHTIFGLLLATAIQFTEVAWKDAPPSLPKGTKIAVLEGSPQQEGLFTIRLKVPAGTVIAPHTHPRLERVTVLSGRVIVNIDGKETTFGAGGFYVNPPNVVHDVEMKEETILQLTCDGPWQLDYVK